MRRALIALSPTPRVKPSLAQAVKDLVAAVGDASTYAASFVNVTFFNHGFTAFNSGVMCGGRTEQIPRAKRLSL